MMIKAPQLSVIMPIYNPQEQYLREAIESILNQTYNDFELLLIDDCSPSRHVDEIVASYADSRIRYFPLPQNLGVTGARNFGIEHAAGEFIAFLDNDDVALPTRLQEQIEFLRAHPAVGMMGSDQLTIPQNKPVNVVTTDQEIKACALFLRCPATQSSVMIRKDVLDKYQVRYRKETTLAEDYAIWLDLLPHTQFANSPKPLILYRWHDNNESVKKAREQFVMTRRLIVQKWQEIYGLADDGGHVLDFLTLQTRSKDDFETVEKFLLDLVDKIRAGHIVDADLGVKYLGKLYRKTLRKYKSRPMVYAMLQSPLTRLFQLDMRFKAEMWFKSLVMKAA